MKTNALSFGALLAVVAGAVACATPTETPSGSLTPDVPPANEDAGGSAADAGGPVDDAGAPLTPPSIKADPAFGGGAGISDATHSVYSATSGPGGVTYVALRKSGGSIGWGNGTLVRRYLPSGSIDTSFATQGELTLTLVANPQALAVDPTGRVLVGGSGYYNPGTTNDSGKEVVVARLTSAGTVDTTFGAQGRAVLSFSQANVFTTSLHVRSDGGALASVYGRTNGKDAYASFLIGKTGAAISGYGASGQKSAPSPTDGAVALGEDVLVPGSGGLERFGPDGAAKGVFINSNVAMVKVGPGGNLIAIAAGSTLWMARYSSSGKRDAAYKSPTVPESVRDFAVRPDGSVIVADDQGLSWVAPSGGAPVLILKGVAVARLESTADGALLVTTSSDSAKVLRYVFF